MRKLMRDIEKRARKNPKKVVFPEGTEDRILKAVKIILRKRLARVILIGDEELIKNKANKFRLNLKKVEIIDHLKSKKLDTYAKKLYKLRKHKGITLSDARKLVRDNMYFSTMMVKLGHAAGLVAGATHSTATTVRPALQIIKTKKRFERVSAVFFMFLKKRLLFFADAAITICPNAKELAEIAIDTAETAKSFGIEPKIALLSFSTHGSAKHASAEKVRKATKIVRQKRPDLIVDGEIQVDAAIDYKVCQVKCPDSVLKGEANVLIFPDLQCSNISYKLVQRLGHAKAVGPVLQGLKKPVNDLSRGCNVEEIVELTAVTVVEAQRKK